MAGVIDTYLAELDRRLAFDPALGARVRAEVEDHLHLAAEAETALPRADAEQRAVQRFGDANEIAARFARDALNAQAGRTWLALAATAGATFIAMRLRRMLLDTGAFDAVPFADFLDRYAFIAALVIGIGGWLIFRRQPHRALDRRFLPVEAAGTLGFVALLFSIAGGAVIALMAGRQFELPALTALLLEIAMAGWLATQVWRLQQRSRAAVKALKG
ncbi:hypothetical protein sos41_19290 [Alphaproteobacteria bacterium SO-S41]|nr:hypothetical protein sos41_19290 [Alphaproteobacteria bacterium SO-S41]